MIVDRPMFSRRFSAEFAASAMDDGDSEHIGTYLDNIEREAPRTVDSAVGDCPSEALIGVGTFRTEPDCEPNPLSSLTPVSAAMPRKRGRPKHGPVEQADSRRKQLKAAWLADAAGLAKKRAQLGRERHAAWQEAEDKYDEARLTAAREEGYAAGFAAGVQSAHHCKRP